MTHNGAAQTISYNASSSINHVNVSAQSWDDLTNHPNSSTLYAGDIFGRIDLGFSPKDRSENIRRLAEVATHLAKNGHIAIVAAVSPSRADRAVARQIADTAFREVHIATPADICESRDPKGHYAKARAGGLPAFTGIGNDYEPPLDCELVIDTSTASVGIPPPSSGRGASRVQRTTPLGVGSPEATPSVNG